MAMSPIEFAPGGGQKIMSSSDTVHQLQDTSFDDDDYETLPANTPLSVSMAAGAVAGIMEHTIMYPVDAIKTRMQIAQTNSQVYRGIVSSMSRITAAEGALSLWRGMLSMVLGAGPAHALHFAVYEAVTSGFNKNGHVESSAVTSGIAGAAATTVADALMNPFDVIKQRMQLQTLKADRHSVLRTAINIQKAEGFRAFYLSYPTTLMMNIPFHTVNFAVYDSISQILNPQRLHDPLIHCISGGIAGASAAAVSTPFDVVKTLLQTRGLSSDAEARKLSGFLQAAKYVWKVEGARGFLKGLRPRVVANMPSTAICWTVYEMAKHYIFKNTNL